MVQFRCFHVTRPTLQKSEGGAPCVCINFLAGRLGRSGVSRVGGTDGRPLPDNDPTPTWNGYSVAKWEGDTLVVHTIGFRDDLWLDSYGNPLTEGSKVTERIRRPNFGTLEIEMTIDDPKTYTAPWTVTMKQPLVLDSELIDYYCLENEKDFKHLVGK